MRRRNILSFCMAFALALIVVHCGLPPALQAQMAMPFVKRDIYSATADPSKDIPAAIRQAKVGHKRIILDFGGNWCGDCIVLDMYMHQSPNAELIQKHFVLVHIDIGQYDRNVDVAKRYKIPLEKGVPALAILDSTGKLLFSQRNKEFEKMGAVTPRDVTEFLKRWKA